MVGLLDVNIFVLRNYLFKTTICLLLLLCSTTEVNDLTPRSDINIERVGSIKIDTKISAAYVNIPQSQSQCLVRCHLERALGVLSKSIKRRPVFRKRGGELDILVLED
jgi:hypothetical protein